MVFGYLRCTACARPLATAQMRLLRSPVFWFISVLSEKLSLGILRHFACIGSADYKTPYSTKFFFSLASTFSYEKLRGNEYFYLFNSQKNNFNATLKAHLNRQNNEDIEYFFNYETNINNFYRTFDIRTTTRGIHHARSSSKRRANHKQ